MSEFETARGVDFHNGPPMYIVTPSDKGKNSWKPTFTRQNPEKVILSRICALAKRSHQYLMCSIVDSVMSNNNNIWMGIFKENSNSLKSYSALLRVNPNLITDSQCSSTGFSLATAENSYELSIQKRSIGPKDLRKRVFKNLNGPKTANAVVTSWNPVDLLVSRLRLKFGHIALFFYNEYTPDVIAILWRPSTILAQSFTTISSEYKRPTDENWEADSLMITNLFDVLQEIQFLARELIVDMKILDNNVLNRNKKRQGISGSKRKKNTSKERISSKKKRP